MDGDEVTYREYKKLRLLTHGKLEVQYSVRTLYITRLKIGTYSIPVNLLSFLRLSELIWSSD